MQVFEKAYAKLAGSYAAVEFGSEDDGLVSLTGVSELVCVHVFLVCVHRHPVNLDVSIVDL